MITEIDPIMHVRPNKFPECAKCPLAGGEMQKAVKAFQKQTGQQPEGIKVNCVHANFLVSILPPGIKRNRLVMISHALRIDDNDNVILLKKTPRRDVTDRCPGLNP